MIEVMSSSLMRVKEPPSFSSGSFEPMPVTKGSVLSFSRAPAEVGRLSIGVPAGNPHVS